jgi:endonuclease/exonuclease/phosphatase family metal-dependent hydrolase
VFEDLPRSATGPDGAGLVIASMNMHCGVGSSGAPFDVRAAVTGLDADVIALQEVWSPQDGPDPVAAAADSLGATLLRVPLRAAGNMRALGIPADSGPGESGMAVLCTLPVTGHAIADLGQIRGDGTRRRALIVTIQLPGGPSVRVAATHLTHRLVSPVQLGRLLGQLDGAALPTVIAGDLNMPGLIAGRVPGYAMAVRGRTWPAELPVTQLDHVLAGRGIRRVAGAVLPPAGSDHLPVRARLRLADARSP